MYRLSTRCICTGFLTTAVIVASAGQGEAQLLSMDWKGSAGVDTLITYDMATNLEWLDLSVTLPSPEEFVTYADVEAQLGEGGAYEGFRIATLEELAGLFPGMPSVGSFPVGDEEYDRVADVQLHLGVTDEQGGGVYVSRGLCDDGGVGTPQSGGCEFGVYPNGAFLWMSADTGLNTLTPTMGMFLVREHVAADPSAMLSDLMEALDAINLARGIDNAFDAKIDAALNALEDVNENNDAAACNALEAFINHCEAQAGNKLTEAEADGLIAMAMEIIAALCGL